MPPRKDTDPDLDELDPAVDPDAVGGGRRSRILSRLAAKLQNPRELGGDAMDLLGVAIETSDRAKTEMVRMVARELRNYLDELKLKEDLHKLVTSHSLEVKVSLSLKPLADATAPSTAAADAPEPKPDADRE